MDFLGKVCISSFHFFFGTNSIESNLSHAPPTQMPDTKDIEEFERMVMEGCDANGDGKINRKELTTVLLALAKHASDEEKQEALQKCA